MTSRWPLYQAFFSWPSRIHLRNRCFMRAILAPCECHGVILSFGLLIANCFGHPGVLPGAEVWTWTAPEEKPLSSTYKVSVNGIPVSVYSAKSVHGGDYAFFTFDFTRTLTVVVAARTNGSRFTPGRVFG
jgi:hypothetical protein